MLTPDTKVANSRTTCCAKTAGKLQIVKRRQRAFKITGLTWIVERRFAWLGRNRRLSKDYEYCVQSSETLIEIAATLLMLNSFEWPLAKWEIMDAMSPPDAITIGQFDFEGMLAILSAKVQAMNARRIVF